MWILKFVPDWTFYIFLSIGILGIIASTFIILYDDIIKIVSSIMIIVSVFMIGAIYNENIWLKKATEFEKKIADAQTKSAIENTKIIEKLIAEKQFYKNRTTEIIKFIDKEVIKYDSSCKIPKEFIDAVNGAAIK